MALYNIVSLVVVSNFTFDIILILKLKPFFSVTNQPLFHDFFFVCTKQLKKR